MSRQTRKQWERFRDRLNELGVTATIRTSRGEDIEAACGMLSGKEEPWKKKGLRIVKNNKKALWASA